MRYRAIDGSTGLTLADTEYEYRIGEGMAEVSFRLSDATASWRWSSKPGVVAGGEGFPMAAGEAQSFPGPMVAQTLYFAAGTAGEVLKFSAQAPAVR